MHGTSQWKVTEVADLCGDRLLMLHGELDIATTPELVRILERMRRHRHPVVVDMSAVTFIDSSGLTALMDARADADREGCAFAIEHPSPAVQRVIQLAGVGRLLGA